jgi:hypothetical protein
MVGVCARRQGEPDAGEASLDVRAHVGLIERREVGPRHRSLAHEPGADQRGFIHGVAPEALAAPRGPA